MSGRFDICGFISACVMCVVWSGQHAKCRNVHLFSMHLMPTFLLCI